MTTNNTALSLVPHAARGPVQTCAQGLSFWGGVDPNTGVIIDAHHPNCGVDLSGKIVLMPTSRGSCSGSGVLLELAQNGHAPAALIFREAEEILTLGAIIADRLFARPVAVLRLPAALFDQLSKAKQATITPDTLTFDASAHPLCQLNTDALDLSPDDQHMLRDANAPARQLAMEVLCHMAIAQGANALIDVTRAHIDGCILAHDANLDFAEKMQQMGARTSIPTTINAISVDRENWPAQNMPADFGHKASRLADAYVKMGARATFTCAPYLLNETPKPGEPIGWSESNAVIYANSVLGARSQKHPDYLDLFIAMTGRAPKSGVYLTANRAPVCALNITLPTRYDDSIWPMLGWRAGALSPGGIPVLCGLETTNPTPDNLKALCAAFGTTSSAAMLHLRGHTPEADLPLPPNAPHLTITPADLAQVWRDFNTGHESVDLVAIGSPHASLSECRELARHLAGRRCHRNLQTIVTLGRDVLARAKSEGILDALSRAGVRLIPDLCWCSITEPILPPSAKTLMTNSGKYAHYAHGLTGRAVRFGSLQDCAKAALSGRAPRNVPAWLEATSPS